MYLGFFGRIMGLSLYPFHRYLEFRFHSPGKIEVHPPWDGRGMSGDDYPVIGLTRGSVASSLIGSVSTTIPSAAIHCARSRCTSIFEAGLGFVALRRIGRDYDIHLSIVEGMLLDGPHQSSPTEGVVDHH
jgi:hypothetical protein